MKGSYFNINSNKVGSVRSFENDFTNPGDFRISEHKEEIILAYTEYPGYYNGKEWVKGRAASEELYNFYIEYKNKNRVDVRIVSEQRYSSPNILNPTYRFVSEAAKKFFLVNNLINYAVSCDDAILSLKWAKGGVEERSWEDVAELMAHANNANKFLSHPHDPNSWYKSMAKAEAEELFRFLKVKILFPF